MAYPKWVKEFAKQSEKVFKGTPQQKRIKAFKASIIEYKFSKVRSHKAQDWVAKRTARLMGKAKLPLDIAQGVAKKHYLESKGTGFAPAGGAAPKTSAKMAGGLKWITLSSGRRVLVINKIGGRVKMK